METIIKLEKEIKMLEKDFNIRESDFDDFIYHTEKMIELQTLKDVLEVIDDCPGLTRYFKDILEKKITGEIK